MLTQAESEGAVVKEGKHNHTFKTALWTDRRLCCWSTKNQAKTLIGYIGQQTYLVMKVKLIPSSVTNVREEQQNIARNE